MSEDNPSVISHVSIGTNRLEDAVDFYDKVLAILGCSRVMEHPGAVAYGKVHPEFWVQTPVDEGAASVGNGSHFGFIATSRQAVDEFYRVALECGGTGDGAPGSRPMYGDPYYGCFVMDLDGNKIEATFWDDTLET